MYVLCSKFNSKPQSIIPGRLISKTDFQFALLLRLLNGWITCIPSNSNWNRRRSWNLKLSQISHRTNTRICFGWPRFPNVFSLSNSNPKALSLFLRSFLVVAKVFLEDRSIGSQSDQSSTLSDDRQWIMMSERVSYFQIGKENLVRVNGSEVKTELKPTSGSSHDFVEDKRWWGERCPIRSIPAYQYVEPQHRHVCEWPSNAHQRSHGVQSCMHRYRDGDGDTFRSSFSALVSWLPVLWTSECGHVDLIKPNGAMVAVLISPSGGRAEDSRSLGSLGDLNRFKSKHLPSIHRRQCVSSYLWWGVTSSSDFLYTNKRKKDEDLRQDWFEREISLIIRKGLNLKKRTKAWQNLNWLRFVFAKIHYMWNAMRILIRLRLVSEDWVVMHSLNFHCSICHPFVFVGNM